MGCSQNKVVLPVVEAPALPDIKPPEKPEPPLFTEEEFRQMPLTAKGKILKFKVAVDGLHELTEAKLRIWRDWAESVFMKEKKPKATLAPNVAVGPKPEAKGTYSETVQPNEGVTHSARRVVQQYLEDSGQMLTPEQGIYAEDDLAKDMDDDEVQPGEVLTWDREAVMVAVGRAKGIEE